MNPAMTGVPEDDEPALVPIDEVARRFGIRSSAIRYYEERGLLAPVSRHSGRRWYGPSELRRLAIIGYWQRSALMSLDDIAIMLAGSGGAPRWADAVDRHIASLAYQIDRMTVARDFLEHVRAHHEKAPDGCPHFEANIWIEDSNER
jgi:MerR family transcriptional regulator, copper efflux regulator